MKREFLSALGLEKEMIDKILDENSTDIEKAQLKATELQGQLTTAKETLKSFEGVDIEELQGKITQLSGDLATKETEYQSKLADMEFASQLDGTISTFGAKNAKAVKALLDIDRLKQSKNQADDIKKAIETVKTDNDYLFASDEPFKNPVKDTGNPNSEGQSIDTMRAIMGLPTQTK